ncbi:MAG: xylose isomerase [Planctomycetota bacterium]|nr:MAG: xylose isomerase [Planctomycetota bacterium]
MGRWIGPGGRSVWLSYCSNVHPASDLAALEQRIETLWRPVRRLLPGSEPLGLGLWLPASLVDALLARPAHIDRLRGVLRDAGWVCVGLNAFPYEQFHAPVVKDAVYRPPWWERERIAYTVAAARVLAALLPEGLEHAAVSTVPLGWRAHAEQAGSRASIAGASLLEAAGALEQLERETGRRIRVLLEPEPGCVLERTDEVLSFLLALCRGHARSAAYDRYLGVCFDCCHQAVLGESLPDSLRSLFEAGVAIGRMQLSAAIEGPLEALAPFAEPRYLHQCVAVDATARADDLPLALADPRLAGRRVRAHFHVPVFERCAAPEVQTTAGALGPALDEVLRWPEPPALEIETYTWSVLPGAPAGPSPEGIAAEWRHVAGLLAERGWRAA